MVAKTNAIYLGVRDGNKTTADGEIIKCSYFQFLVFNVETTTSIEGCALQGVYTPSNSQLADRFYSRVPEVLGRCVLDVDIYINPITKIANTRIVDISEVM